MAANLVTVASANSGSAVVTYWRAFYDTSNGRKTNSAVIVSNPSHRDVEVTLRLYDANGNAIGTPGFLIPVTASLGFTGCNGTNNVCTLPAGKMGQFLIGGAANMDSRGYGILEWSSSSPDSSPTALIAAGTIYYVEANGEETRMPMLITRDQPF
jgi:hypothetical protein